MSPGCRKVWRLPTIKSAKGIRRLPACETSSTSASSASNGGTLSAAGDALQRFPATVPRFWIWIPPICRAAAFKASKHRGSGILIISDQVVSPPIWIYCGVRITPLSSRSPEMSTTERPPREGKKSVPPAKTCPPEWARACTASASVLGLRYRDWPHGLKSRTFGRKTILVQKACFGRAEPSTLASDLSLKGDSYATRQLCLQHDPRLGIDVCFQRRGGA